MSQEGRHCCSQAELAIGLSCNLLPSKLIRNQVASGPENRDILGPFLVPPKQACPCVPVLRLLRAVLPVLSLTGYMFSAVLCHQPILTTPRLPQVPLDSPLSSSLPRATRSMLCPAAVCSLYAPVICLPHEPECCENSLVSG